MFTGTTIDELINAVERVEQQACVADLMMAASDYSGSGMIPAFTYMYDFATMQQMVIGVA